MTPAPLAEAWAWLDAVPWQASETVAPAAALGRVLAAPVTAAADWPDRDRACRNGFAVCAAQTEGASAYNPVAPAGGMWPVASGEAMPAPADAVLPRDAVEAGAWVATSIAPGEGVVRRGAQLRAGAALLPAGHRLRPPDIAVLAGVAAALTVCAAPRVQALIAAPRHGTDLLTPLLAALLTQDGAIASCRPAPASAALAAAGAAGAADLLVLAGRCGDGTDDDTPAALRHAGGRVVQHGVALHPGTASGFGWLGKTPVLLLPGEPLAALAAYMLLAARLVRRMSGRVAPAPAQVTLRRKISSGVGYAEMACVRLAEGQAEPLAGGDSAGLAAAARADGYVLVPETSEGFAPGSVVAMHRFAV